MVFSRATEYALKSLVHISKHPGKNYFGVRELALELEISISYLAKILQKLAREDVLCSSTGPGGGFCLSEAGASLNLFQIIEIMEEESFQNKCVLGWENCGVENPCPMHSIWGPYRESLIKYLKENRISDLTSSHWPEKASYLNRNTKKSGKKKRMVVDNEE